MFSYISSLRSGSSGGPAGHCGMSAASSSSLENSSYSRSRLTPGSTHSRSLSGSAPRRGSGSAKHASKRSRGGVRSRSPRSSSGGQRRARSLEQLALSSISAGTGSSGRGGGRATPASTPWSQRRRTPGSVTPRPAQSSTVLALAAGRGHAAGAVGLAALDPQAPQLVLSQLGDTYTYAQVVTKVHVLNPCEVLLPATLCTPGQQLYRLLCEQLPLVTLTALPRQHFQPAAGLQRVAELCLPSLAGLLSGLKHMYYSSSAAAALLLYMESVRSVVFRPHTLKVEMQAAEATVMINSETCRRLELVQPAPGGRPEHTVYSAIRRTQTPGGCRRLRAELLQPSLNPVSIRTRHDCVQELVDSPDLLYRLRAVVGRFRDVERIHSFCIQKHDWETERNVEQRLNNIIALKSALEFVEALREALAATRHPFFVAMRKFLSEPAMAALLSRLRAVLHDDVQPCRGGVEQRVQRCYAIKAGINGMLDLARRLCSEAYDEFVCYVAQQAEEHRLPLKPGFNSTRGFHLVCAFGRGGRTPQLPPHFIQARHSRTSATCTTEAVIQLNQRADAAVREICALSNVVVCELLNQLQPQLAVLYQLAEMVSTTDLLVGFAELATGLELRRPQFGCSLLLRGSWHPLLTAATATPAVPSHLEMPSDYRLLVITGANMSGKSTLLKQVAITLIMAQMGSFVPAETALLPIIDQIFLRSGCEQRAEWQSSSFQAEMREVACALQQATPRSLVLLDELGRATAAEEGAGLTWAVCEALLRRRCRTLAATHYPQCCHLAQLWPAAVLNYHVGVCDGDEAEAAAPTPDEAAARSHRVYSGPLRRAGYGLSLAASTSLSPSLVQQARHLLLTALRPPGEALLSPRLLQERQLLQLAARLEQLHRTPDQLPPQQLRQLLTELRQQFVREQLEAATAEGTESASEESSLPS